MRSSTGVGMTPPKVLETPKPWSSVMISSTLGAPLGGTTRAGQYGLESLALSLMTPPNFAGGAGTWLPLIVVVALGEPGVPVISGCCAGQADGATDNAAAASSAVVMACTSRVKADRSLAFLTSCSPSW